jgi:hypothetical protein
VLYKGLMLYSATEDLPTPENKIDIVASEGHI